MEMLCKVEKRLPLAIPAMFACHSAANDPAEMPALVNPASAKSAGAAAIPAPDATTMAAVQPQLMEKEHSSQYPVAFHW